ncbi:MAG: T9SS type A sorting domain-containing protein [Bacteroidota bacterium]
MKNYNLLFCLLVILGMGNLRGQSFERTVIGPAGTTTTVANVNLSWTTGEMITKTVAAGSFILNQGFQQANPSNSTGIDEELAVKLDYKIYPNPSSDQLNIELESEVPLFLQLELIDMRGRKTPVASKDIDLMNTLSTSLDVSILAKGNYQLLIIDRKSGARKGILLQKN